MISERNRLCKRKEIYFPKSKPRGFTALSQHRTYVWRLLDTHIIDYTAEAPMLCVSTPPASKSHSFRIVVRPYALRSPRRTTIYLPRSPSLRFYNMLWPWVPKLWNPSSINLLVISKLVQECRSNGKRCKSDYIQWVIDRMKLRITQPSRISFEEPETIFWLKRLDISEEGVESLPTLRKTRVMICARRACQWDTAALFR